MPQTKTPAKRIKLLITLLIVGFIVINVLNRWTAKDTFCTVEDKVYQTIASNMKIWATQFFESPNTAATNVIYFSTVEGERHTAIKYGDDQFFVFTETTTPHTYFERKGYLYSPADMPNIGNYQYTDLGESIYCYQLDR